MIPLDISKSMIYQKQQQQQKCGYETQSVIEKEEEAYCSHLKSILFQRSSIIIFNRDDDVDDNNNNNNERINDDHGTDKVVMPKHSLKQQNIEKNQKEKIDSGSMVDDYITSSNNNNNDTSIDEMKILLNQRFNKSIDSFFGIINGNDHHQDFNKENGNINLLMDRFSLSSIENNDNNLRKEQLDHSKQSKMMIQNQRKISPENYCYCCNDNNNDSITTIRTIKSTRSQQQIKNNKDNPTMIFDYKTVININDKNDNKNISNINININNPINRITTTTTTTNRLINQWNKCFNNNNYHNDNNNNNLIKNNEAIKSKLFNKNHHYNSLLKSSPSTPKPSSSSSSLGSLSINNNTSWMYYHKKTANFILHWTLLFLLLLSTLEIMIQLNNYDNNYNLVQAISNSSYQPRSSSSQHQQQQEGIYASSSYHYQKSLPISSSASIHHRHDRLYPFERAKQLKRNNNNNGNGIGNVDPTCPNCRLKLNRTQAEQMKLDAIKQQILSKLNLEFRPNITKQQEDNSVAREEAMEIIRKAKLDLIFENHNQYDLSTPSSLKQNRRQQRHHRRHRRRESGTLGNDDQQFTVDSVDRKIIQSKSRTSNNNDEDDQITLFHDNDDDDDDNEQNFVDEYFGKTSEIIIFAEPDHKLNGHILVKLTAPENYYKLNVSKAILWLRLILNRRKLNRMNDENRMKALKQMVKLYVFKVANSSMTESSSSSATLMNNIGRYQQQPEINPRLFQNHSTFPNSNQKQNDYDYNGITTSQQQQRLSFQLLAVHKLTKLRHGWIKINLTSAIHEWFDQSLKTTLMQQKPTNSEQKEQDSKTKIDQNQHQLKLLIDCAGCNDLLDIDLGPNNNKNNKNNNNNDTANIIRKSTNPTDQHNNNNANSHMNHHLLFQHHQQQQQLRKRDDNGSEKNGISNGKNRQRKQRRRYRPFIVLTTESRSKRRSRRHAYNCEDGIRQCCKQSLYVNFEELGWNDWIIYPRGYQANYCMGECVQMRTPDMLAYFHSHVLEEYRIKNPYASITPCCAPTKLSSISLIYFDQNRNIIKADLPKMVVNECGCT